MRKELLIHFTDVNVCLNQLKELKVKISPQTRNLIKLLHSSVITVINGMPNNVVADVCFRTANRILSTIELETEVRFNRYKKHHYKLS